MANQSPVGGSMWWAPRVVGERGRGGRTESRLLGMQGTSQGSLDPIYWQQYWQL